MITEEEIIVGDKNKFALTCEICLEDPSVGNVYIYIGNKKFGNDRYTYDLDFFLWHAEGEFSVKEFVYPAFFSMTSFEMTNGIHELYADYPDYKLCKFEDIFPGFIKAFETSDENLFCGMSAEDTIEEILMRGGNYGLASG